MSERTILLDVYSANQKRERLIEAALAGTDLPPEDYPVYVMIGIEGPLTPTDLARSLGMPLSTALFRAKRLERRGHVERMPHPDDGRSFLLRLTPQGEKLLAAARPAFRDLALAVEERLGAQRVGELRDALAELEASIDAELTPEPVEPAP